MKVILECQHAVGVEKIRGIGYYSLNLIQTLLERNNADYGLTFFDYNRERGNNTRVQKYFASYGVPVYEVNNIDFRDMASDDRIFENQSYNDITGSKADIYHFMNIFTIPSKLEGKMVVTIHDMSFVHDKDFNPPYINQWYNEGIRRAEKLTNAYFITDSYASKKDILKYTSIPEERIDVIYLSYDDVNNYVDKDSKSIVELGIDGDYILFVGTIEYKKNVERIIDAFNIVAEKNTDIQLVLAGEIKKDKYEQINKKIESSKYKERIICLDYVDNDIKRKLYSNAKLFMFPSLNEGFGLPILEAQACGCPVVTSCTTSCPEVAGEAAILVDPLNVEDIAKATERILNSDELRNDLIQKGFENIKLYSWHKTAEQVEKFYEKVSKLK